MAANIITKRKNDEQFNRQMSNILSVLFLTAVVILGGAAFIFGMSQLPSQQTTALTPSLSYIRDGVTYHLNLNTGESTSLGTQPDLFYAPPISPDGKWAATWEMNGSELAHVVVFDAASNNIIARHPVSSMGSRLSWSADSQSLLLTAQGPDASTGMSDLWLMQRETGVLTRLTYTPQVELDPVFSPDGSKIAYITVEDTGDYRLYVMDVATQSVRMVTTEYNANRPTWSPDGQSIAFEATQDGSASHIALVHADGTNLKLLTDGTGYSYTPLWIN